MVCMQTYMQAHALETVTIFDFELVEMFVKHKHIIYLACL